MQSPLGRISCKHFGGISKLSASTVRMSAADMDIGMSSIDMPERVVQRHIESPASSSDGLNITTTSGTILQILVISSGLWIAQMLKPCDD